VSRSLRRILVAVAVLSGSAQADAQTNAANPIRIIVPVPPGGTNDLVARLLSDHITGHTGQTVVIENRGGAGGNIAMGAVARAAPDGHTLLLASGGPITTNRLLYKNIGLNPLTDLEPIGPLADIKLIAAINRNVPAASLTEFFGLARARPGKINFTSAGPGSTTHLAGALLARIAGVEMVHVPHRGAGPAVVDVVAGNIEMITLGVNTLAPFILSGDLRALAAASTSRLAYLPTVPTAREAGIEGWDVDTWFGLFGPRGMPRDLVQRLNNYIQELLDVPANQKRMSDSYMDAWRMSPDQFAEFLKADGVKWERIVRDTGMQPE
jgi:tripartite-type tricarboxylate transporter receptor subunit TctC